MGEVPDIWNTQVCNLWWHWPWNWMRPEVFRYVLPESIQSWTIDAFEHEHEVGRAFAMGFLLNVNVPNLPENELSPVITYQGRRRYEGRVERRVDPRGRAYFWLGGEIIEGDAEEGCSKEGDPEEGRQEGNAQEGRPQEGHAPQEGHVGPSQP
jgi:hypothetical protein